ncbi:MAG: Txe/YoeB family addiction module toxin [Defluviitaleaceae bacterium]|nr:Txe/YoeB family addiction module toxin [Defluviitaleaceae bacterium]MCL2275278.1 Txe/YoeB family addiction module toxin [Defluviitaleaceae bacterium]
MKTSFTDKGLLEYMEWLEADKKKLKKINELIKSILRDGLLNGLGKPEKLKWTEGYSREIDKYNRLVYRVDEHKNLEIISCKGHYNDK